MDRTKLFAEWRATADSAGFDEAHRIALIARAEAAPTGEHKRLLAAQGEMQAHRAVAFANEKLGERLSVFSGAELEKEAGRFALGQSSYRQIQSAMPLG